MNFADKELTPVEYSAAAVKVLHHNIEPHAICFRTHWHERIEIIRLIEGEMQVDFGSAALKLNEGELVIFPPRTPHRAFAGDNGVRYDVLMFDVRSFYNDTAVCQSVLPAIFDGRVKFGATTKDADIISCVDTICNAADQGSLEITAYLYRLLHLLFSKCLIEHKTQVSNNSVKEITDYIEQNFAENLSTDGLSSRFGYTPSHFCRKFKEATGLTPIMYIKIFRLERACKMIKKGESNIGDIAARCGFDDANYFARCFKAHFGVPPTFYKAK